MRITPYAAGTGCNNDACYQCDVPIDTQTSGCETVTITASALGKRYYWFVSSVLVTSNVSFSWTLSFSGSLAPNSNPVAPPVYQPSCLTGEILTLDVPVVRSFSAGDTAGFASACGGLSSTQKGKFFRLPAALTGEIYVHTCGRATDVNTEIIVFGSRGVCQACSCPSCAGSNDDRNSTHAAACSSTRASVFYHSNLEADLTYYVFVGGNTATINSGTFELRVSKYPPVAPSPPSSSSEAQTPALSTGALVGIGVGAAVFLILLIAIIAARCVRSRPRVPQVATVVVQPTAVVSTPVAVYTQQTTTFTPLNSVEMQPMHPPGYYT